MIRSWGSSVVARTAERHFHRPPRPRSKRGSTATRSITEPGLRVPKAARSFAAAAVPAKPHSAHLERTVV